MIDVHSILLALAIFLLGLAIAALAASLLGAGIQRWRAPKWFPRAVLILLILALTFDGLSLIVHVLMGHRPGTSQAMDGKSSWPSIRRFSSWRCSLSSLGVFCRGGRARLLSEASLANTETIVAWSGRSIPVEGVPLEECVQFGYAVLYRLAITAYAEKLPMILDY